MFCYAAAQSTTSHHKCKRCQKCARQRCNPGKIQETRDVYPLPNAGPARYRKPLPLHRTTGVARVHEAFVLGKTSHHCLMCPERIEHLPQSCRGFFCGRKRARALHHDGRELGEGDLVVLRMPGAEKLCERGNPRACKMPQRQAQQQ